MKDVIVIRALENGQWSVEVLTAASRGRRIRRLLSCAR